MGKRCHISFAGLGFEGLRASDLHQTLSTGFVQEIQYVRTVLNRVQRAPVEVFSMHQAFPTRETIYSYSFN